MSTKTLNEILGDAEETKDTKETKASEDKKSGEAKSASKSSSTKATEAKTEKSSKEPKEGKEKAAKEAKEVEAATESSDSKSKEPVSESSEDVETKVDANPEEVKGATSAKVETSVTKYAIGSTVKLTTPLPIYRGPGFAHRGKSFGGTVTVTGGTDENGFTPVEFVRSGLGLSSGYIRFPEGGIK